MGHVFHPSSARLGPGETPGSLTTIEVVNPYRQPGSMSEEEEYLLLSHEREAAELGLALIHHSIRDGSPVSSEDLVYYSRMFWADYHYLRNVIITGKGGSDVFDQFYEKETDFELLHPRNELVDLRVHPPCPQARKIVVV